MVSDSWAFVASALLFAPRAALIDKPSKHDSEVPGIASRSSTLEAE